MPDVAKLGAASLFVLLTRLFLGFTFFSSGLCKLSGGSFGQLIGPCHLEELLIPYGLQGLALLIAVSQALVGALILSQRYALLGSVMLVPMNVAILGVTTSGGWGGTPFINAALLLLNAAVLLYDRPRLRFLIQPEHREPAARTELDELHGYRWWAFAVLGAAMLAVVAARAAPPATMAFGGLSLLIAFLNTLVHLPLTRLQRSLIVLSGMDAVLMAFLPVFGREGLVVVGLSAPVLMVLYLAELALGMRRRRQRSAATHQPST